jgi:hypothetical protein
MKYESMSINMATEESGVSYATGSLDPFTFKI